MDLFVHQMSVFDHIKAEKDFNIQDGYTAISVLALGYIGKAENLPEELKKMELSPRERNDIASFVFEGDFK